MCKIDNTGRVVASQNGVPGTIAVVGVNLAAAAGDIVQLCVCGVFIVTLDGTVPTVPGDLLVASSTTAGRCKSDAGGRFAFGVALTAGSGAGTEVFATFLQNDVY